MTKIVLFRTLELIVVLCLTANTVEAQFITTWSTTDGSITIPTTGTGYNYDVAWFNETNLGVGDGSTSGEIGDITISGLSNGDTYRVEITGTFPRIYFNNGAGGQDISKIISIDQWGSISWSNMASAFRGCTNLTYNATDAPDLSLVTSLSNIFQGCTLFDGDLSLWDVSTITNFEFAFAQASSFNQPLDNWNMTSATSIRGMFQQASTFNQPLNSWTFTQLNDCRFAFSETSSFNQPLGSWNISNVTLAQFMFFDATAFNQPVDSWDVSGITSFAFMFEGATSFNQSLGAWDISSATSLSGIIDRAPLSIENYDNTLIGWATLDAGETQIPGGFSDVGVLNQSYSNTAIAARTTLENTYSWVFIGDANSFVTTWSTTDGSITIPTAGTGYSYKVVWRNVTNPGVSEGSMNSQTSDVLITGLENGSTYRIDISGDFPRIYFNSGNEGQEVHKILTIEKWGDIAWMNMRAAFAGCANLAINATDGPDLSGAGDITAMFMDCTGLTTPDLTAWDVSGVSSMATVFFGATNFNGNITNWTTTSSTRMDNMFRDASSFNQDISGWDMSNVSNISSMFFGASAFNQNLSAWDVSNVTTFTSAFADATSFNNGEASGASTSPLSWTINTTQGAGVTLNSTFSGTTSFNQDLSSWDVSEVTDMAGLFSESAFNQDLSTWASQLGNVIKMTNLFRDNIAFNQDLSTWDVTSVDQFSGMFDGATAFNNGDLAGASSMPLNWTMAVLPANTFMNAMFREAIAFNQDLSAWNVSNVTTMAAMFQNATAFDGNISTWNVSGVTAMNNMFLLASSFNQDISGWDVSNVTNFGGFMSGASSFSQDISGWNTSSATTMGNMLNGCASLDLDLGNWNVSMVTNMFGMLDGAGLSPANYTAILVGWAAQSIQPDVTFGASGLSYLESGEVSRAILTSAPNNWIITDAGLDAAPVVTIDLLETNTPSPELTGTIDDADASIELTIEGSTYSATNNGDGTWTLAAGTITALSDDTYDVVATATDPVGNVGVDTTADELSIDLTAPVLTIDVLVTNEVSPELTGTIDDVDASVEVTIEGSTYAGLNNQDGTWTLAAGTITPDLTEGIYDVVVAGTDGVGNVGLDTTVDELSIDLTAPLVTITELATSISSPALEGTVDDPAATLALTLDGEAYLPTNNGDGTWTLVAGTVTSLIDGTYDVAITATDVVGNVGVDATTNELVITQDILTLAASNVTSTSFTARWSQMLDVDFYTVEVSRSSDFSELLSGYDPLTVNDETQTSAMVTGLDFGTSYYYRVRFTNTSSEESSNSNVTSTKTLIDATTEADSLALLAMYTEVSPEGLNWQTSRLRDWTGISLDETKTRVTGVDISSTVSTGALPNPFTDEVILMNGGLSALTTFIANDNELTGLIDFSGTSIQTIDVSNNHLTFSDLEPLTTLELTSFTYANQADVVLEAEEDPSYVREVGSLGVVRIVPQEEDYTIRTGLTGVDNSYSWSKDGAAITAGNRYVLDGGNLIIQSIDIDNMGQFAAEVSSTNAALSALTLTVVPEYVFAVVDVAMELQDFGGDLLPTDERFTAALLSTTLENTSGYDTLYKTSAPVPPLFEFTDVILGDYLCGIDPANTEDYVPTYFGDAFTWEDAETIALRNTSTLAVRMTEEPDNVEEGPGKLTGLIEEDFGEDEEGGRIEARRVAKKRKCGLRRRRTGGRISQDNSDFELFAYGETNDDGEFEFGFLPEGTYQFFVEYPGIPLDESAFVEFTVGEQGISDTEFSLNAFATADGVEVTIDRVLGIILTYFKDLRVYPNPADEYVKIDYRYLKSSTVRAELVDLTGKSHWSQDMRSGFDGSISLDVSKLTEGIYLLRFYDQTSKNENVLTFRISIK